MATVILAVIPTGTVVIHTDPITGTVTIPPTARERWFMSHPAIIGIITVAFITGTIIIGNGRTIQSN
jgi:hypothetical protein